MSQELSDSFGTDFKGRVVAVFSVAAGDAGAVALTGKSCELAVKQSTGPIEVVKNQIPTDSKSATPGPSRSAVAKAIGPSSAVGVTVDSNALTLYCGTKGATVEFDHDPGKMSATGSVLQLPQSGSSKVELVIASSKTLDGLR